MQDITTRRETFEFQTLRYAASLAKLNDIDELIHQIYVPYLEKSNATLSDGLMIFDKHGLIFCVFFMITKLLKKILMKKQSILVASEFDEQTWSAVA